MDTWRWLAALVAYGWGSVPWSWLVARYATGADLRFFGTGSVGVSNVRQAAGPAAAGLAILLDVSKGMLPAYLALHARWGLGWALVLGIAATAGHCWSLWLGLRGGRGVAVTAGVLLVTFWAGFLWLVGWLLVGRWLRHVPEANLLALVTLPALAWTLHAPSPLVPGTAMLTLLVVFKRLEANRLSPPPGVSWTRVLRNRLLYDRDIEDRDVWVHRQRVV